MASRATSLVRGLSLAAPRIKHKTILPGMPVDTTAYTSTGGTGADSTALSPSLEAATRKAIWAYRTALRDVPAMRRNFTIMEEQSFVNAVIRDNFERHESITDPKIVDMLVFKALQELREIREQWKSRHQVYSYIQRYSERVFLEELDQKAASGDSSDRYEKSLKQWREQGLVPPEISTWTMFTNWRQEEDLKFRNFALENKLFSSEQLERNASPSPSCNIM